MRHYSERSRRLVAIECDECGALIAPNPRIAESGWMKCGRIDPLTDERDEWDYCPDHAYIAERMGNNLGNKPENDTGQNAANVCPDSGTISDTD